MEIVQSLSIESKQKREFIEAMAEAPVEMRSVALRLNIPIRVVRRWQADDSDFDLAMTEATECALDLIEYSMYNKCLSGDGKLALDVLKARRPQKFNPQPEELANEATHRFIGFNGEELHEDAEQKELEEKKTA